MKKSQLEKNFQQGFFHIESFIKLHHQDAEWQAS